MEKMFLVVALIAGLLLLGLAVKATQDTDTSGVTVTVASYVSIQGLGAVTINVSTPGLETTGTDDFSVDTNESSGSIAVEVTTQPSGLSGMTASVSPTTLTTAPGTTNVTLTAAITVALTESPGDYTGGLITVTVTAPP